MEPTDAQKLRTYKEKLSKQFPITAIKLFGSRARGTARPDSDYDLIIISNAFKNIPFLKRSLPCYDAWDYTLFNTGADILCYTPEEYQKKKEGLNIISIADKEGVTI